MINKVLDLIFFIWSISFAINSPSSQVGGFLGSVLLWVSTCAGLYILMYFRANPQEIPDFSRIPTFDGFDNPILARYIFWAAQVVFIHVWIYYMWSHDYWHASNEYWISMYCYWWFTGYMFYRWRKQ